MIFIPKSGKNIRTPASITVTEKEMRILGVQLKASDQKYNIEEITEDGIDKPVLPSVSKKVVIEELAQPQKKEKNAEPESFLDKLIADQN